MLLCCAEPETNLTISDLSGIANIVIAIISLLLACYIFIYQRGKDKNDKDEIAKLQEQNIRLQWFKELIIQPHLSEINHFYSQLHSIESKFSEAPISEELSINLNAFIKLEHSKLRRSFYDVILAVNPAVHLEIKNNLDTLIDKITNAIFNMDLNLNDKATFDKEIGSIISYSYNDLISKIYNYKGN